MIYRSSKEEKKRRAEKLKISEEEAYKYICEAYVK